MAIRVFKDGKEVEKYKISPAAELETWEIESQKKVPIYEPIREEKEGLYREE